MERRKHVAERLEAVDYEAVFRLTKGRLAEGGLSVGVWREFAFGQIGERVNTSDWEGRENIGGVNGGSCWCEVSLMLPYIEVPGTYVQKDTGFIYSFDQVDARFIEHSELVSVIEPRSTQLVAL